MKHGRTRSIDVLSRAGSGGVIGGVREGSVDRSTLMLIVAASVSIGLIAIAGLVLLSGGSSRPDSSESTEMDVEEQASPLDTQGEIAPMETVEEILESVQVYASRQEFAQAQTILERSIVRYPGDTVLRYALGDLKLRQQDYSGAYDQFVAGLDVDREPEASTHFTAGTLASTIGEREMAADHYAKALKLDPSNPEYPLYLSNVQLGIGRIDEARASIAIAARLAPGRAEVWATWANIALRDNALDLALQQARKAKDIQPKVAAWSVLEAKVLNRMGEPEDAIVLLTGLSAADIEAPDTARILASSYGMVGRPQDGASVMVESARAHAEDAVLAFDAAVWLARADQIDEAQAWGRRAMELGHARAKDWLASLNDDP